LFDLDNEIFSKLNINNFEQKIYIINIMFTKTFFLNSLFVAFIISLCRGERPGLDDPSANKGFASCECCLNLFEYK
jgi:hypothetical protein